MDPEHVRSDGQDGFASQSQTFEARFASAQHSGTGVCGERLQIVDQILLPSRYRCLVPSADMGFYAMKAIEGNTRRNGGEVVTTMETVLDRPIEAVFDFIAAEGVLPIVLTGYGMLPAVRSTSGNTGPWDQPGSSRTVHLADGTTSREEVTDCERPRYFAYRTSDYTFALKYLASSARGQWWFEDRDRRTHVRWTYTFTAQGALTAILLGLFSRFQWAGYMRVCLANTHAHFDGTRTSAL